MNLADLLCYGFCVDKKLNFEVKDEYGDIVEPSLCPCPEAYKKDEIPSLQPVTEIKPVDTAKEAAIETFNKMNCS